MPSKLALFIPSLAGGGAEKMMLHLAGHFSVRGHHVDLLLARAVGPLKDQIPTGTCVIDFNRSMTVAALVPLVRYLRRERPDILLATINHANLVAIVATKLAGVKTKLYVREANTITDALKVHSSLKLRIIPQLMRRLYTYADGIIAISKGVKESLQSVLVEADRDRIRVIYNPAIQAKMRDAASAPVPRITRRVISVGRLVPQGAVALCVGIRCSAISSDMKLSFQAARSIG